MMPPQGRGHYRAGSRGPHRSTHIIAAVRKPGGCHPSIHVCITRAAGDRSKIRRLTQAEYLCARCCSGAAGRGHYGHRNFKSCTRQTRRQDTAGDIIQRPRSTAESGEGYRAASHEVIRAGVCESEHAGRSRAGVAGE